MVIFTVIFGGLARVDSDGQPYALFSYAALVPWLYFSTALTASALSLVSNTDMLTKVYFPRLIFPLTPIFSKLVDFVISFVIIFALMAWFRVMPTARLLYVPLLVLLLMLATAGLALGVLFGALNMLCLLYTSWSAALIGQRFGPSGRLLFGLYPMVGIIEGFRVALLSTGPMPWDMLAVGTVSSLLIFVTGLFYFRRMEVNFADVV